MIKKTIRYIFLPFIFVTGILQSAGNEINKADSLFNTRFVHFNKKTILTDSVAVNEAIRLYRHILRESSDKRITYEALWKLLQAYYFKGNFTTDNTEEKKEIFSTGIDIGEHYIDVFADSVEINCWLGILWGYWGEVHSSLAAARKGVPGKVKHYAEKTIELDDHYLEAGGYRMLGRLHYMVPKIPLIMGWPSNDKSLRYLKKANEIAPDNLLNKLYLAETLYATGDKTTSKQFLQDIINNKKIVHDIIIDTWAKNQAQIAMQKLFPINSE